METNTERSWWPPETKYGIWKCAFQGNCDCVIEDGQKNPAEKTGMRYKNVNLMSRCRNGWDQSAASVKLKTLNDNP